MRDIGDALGMRAPSLYNHVVSKQGLLRDIMFSTMEEALSGQRGAVSEARDAGERLWRATEAHARLPMRRPREVIVTNREVPSLEEPYRARLDALRAEYERGFREIVDRGVAEGRFDVGSPRLATFAILGMTNEISSWFREGGPLSEDEIAHHYADMALRLVGARTPSS
jgi:AcrR family transcriptional regulator